MFRTAELGRAVKKADFKTQEAILRQELLEVQQDLLKDGRFPVIIVFAGVDGAGKGQTVNLLNAWLDPRWLVTRAYGTPSDEEKERPEFWRYWRDLPSKGQIGFFLSSWYSRPLLDRVHGKTTIAEFDEQLDRIVSFENALADDGAVILNFWMHLSKEAQRKRLKSLEKDPLTRWQIKDSSWEHWRMYDQFVEASERIIMRTSTAKGPIHIVEGADPYYRSLTVGYLIRDTIRKRLDELKVEDKVKADLQIDDGYGKVIPMAEAISQRPLGTAIPEIQIPTLTVLDKLDMSKSLSKEKYNHDLKKYQAKLNLLHRKAEEKGVSTLLVFEGPDAAGKGGAIRRITAALDARNYQAIPFAAPSDEEKAHHYLWRFWRHLSRAGRITIYDRSWYGRVLVERVEGFAREAEWKRAFAEINDFEDRLIQHGIVLMKYWVHITKDEQLTRFQDREKTPHKRWKLTEEDWRNREKWDDYVLAVNDMVQQTSTHTSPWILVEGNDKRYARIQVLRQLCHKLEAALDDDE
jgi:polyphosphate:AMP phosphotransferase